MRGCREIQFSNGGHLFATTLSTNAINVYNFYTGENPQAYQFKAHLGKVKSVYWCEDDFGFISCGLEGAIYVWNLHDNNNREFELLQKYSPFFSVVKIPNTNTIYAVGLDKTIKEIEKG